MEKVEGNISKAASREPTSKVTVLVDGPLSDDLVNMFINGYDVVVTFEAFRRCPDCNGKGTVPYTRYVFGNPVDGSMKKCPYCKGKGKVKAR